MGTKARIATVCQGGHFYPTVEDNRKHVLALLDLALRQGPDLVCLPEAFTTVSVPCDASIELAEPVPGPTTDAVARRARQHGCYVICPIQTIRQGACWNSAVVIDRSGEVLGTYDKVHPVTSSSDYTVFESGVAPGRAVPTFDLDFGRIGVQICFDIGFPESWQQLSDQGARMVFWPSAYNGGFPLQVYAYLHHYYVVSSVRTDKSRIVDPCGIILAETDDIVNVIYRDVNLDYVVSHYDFNYSMPDRIMAAYPGQVQIRPHRDDAHFVVEPLEEGLTTEQLQREFGFESTSQYHARHRRAYRRIHDGRAPAPQQALHGERPPYAKQDPAIDPGEEM
jgi:predicted amidohydrolase